MNINRRDFIFMTAAVPMVGMYTCNPTSVLVDLEQWIPEGIEGIDEIVTLINPGAGAILTGLTSAIPGLWTAVTNAIAEYESTTPPPVGTLAKVTTALQDLSDNLAQIIAALPSNVSIPAALLLSIKLGLQLTIATLNWFAKKHGATVPAKLTAAEDSVACATNRKTYIAKFNALKIKRKDGTVIAIH